MSPFTFPRLGKLSRKERDELKAFGQERGLVVYDEGPKSSTALYERCEGARR